MTERREAGALEAEILALLWRADSELTPAEVRESLGEGLAYTTVMTVLTRLWKKGLLERRSRGRAFAYRPAVSEADLAADRMRAALERASDREAALSRFVGRLRKRDEHALRRILGDLEQR